MVMLGVVRVREKELREIIAAHLSAKYGIPVNADKVDFWTKEDRYGNAPFVDVDMTEHSELLVERARRCG